MALGTAQRLGPQLFGFTPTNPGGTGTAITNGAEPATPAQTGGLQAPAYSPDNPLFWFALLLIGTAAAVAYSGRVKLGASAKADASI